jgi:hypothetical protein
MTNINCLENIACPNCRNADRLNIVVTAVATITDDGVEVTGAVDWHDRSFMSCPNCRHDGTFGQFRSARNHRVPPHPHRTNPRRAARAGLATKDVHAVTGTNDVAETTQEEPS